MKAVDIVASAPDVDSTRMGVTGGSYGGVMAAWVTAKTNRFKAAQADRMISNWWSWYGTQRCAGAHRVRVLRDAVGQSGDVRLALPDPLRAERADPDASSCSPRRTTARR
jgi:dienelactone hydrolase